MFQMRIPHLQSLLRLEVHFTYFNQISSIYLQHLNSANFSDNTMYAVNLLNLCTNATMKIMNNLKFSIPDPHMWTNITVIVKNQYGEVLIPVSFNGTGEL